MVLEGYLSRLLVDRFGRYVKGLDAENLRLSAWKGEVRELDHVPGRPFVSIVQRCETEPAFCCADH